MGVTELDADYLVVGAGAAGLAFTDALVQHSDSRVILVDRRHGVGGHWLDAYPFVQLHQSSSFYGVASTLLGGNRIQEHGPETGLHERATAPEICAYYDRVLRDRLLRSGQVRFYPNCDHLGNGRFVSHVSGQAYEVRSRRVVDARYLSPAIPATTPPPFTVADGVRVIPVGELVDLAEAPAQFVIAGSGKTATDACVWLLGNGVDPDAICWVRPRDPWMLDRAVVQPDPIVFISTAASIMEAAEKAGTADHMFALLEEAGLMLRIDRSVTPTMAKIPTLARWELDRLRSIEHVVRLGHLRRVDRGRLTHDDGEVRIADDAVIVHCAASGLRYPPLVPIWGREVITLQPIQMTFLCFGAALAGFVEATMPDDDEKNRVCPPAPFSNTPTDWARQQVLGARASSSGWPARVREWADATSLNPARIPPESADSAEVLAAQDRLRRHAPAGMAKMAEFAGLRAPQK